eukprot:CAMPEP_0175200726 /NCGR_PEP_ID=MMETSP0093-20121207/9683_1 /TAXON_ID=311494 /ORGANISM="Alexandrium monilatum, Strain CCMP3105" /LENGTH=66 /DNA_ID=CAMNT_0016493743 /DNA_START=86 /DNA_END=283 /DNA_ORIENTATION=+
MPMKESCLQNEAEADRKFKHRRSRTTADARDAWTSPLNRTRKSDPPAQGGPLLHFSPKKKYGRKFA